MMTNGGYAYKILDFVLKISLYSSYFCFSFSYIKLGSENNGNIHGFIFLWDKPEYGFTVETCS